MTELEISIGGRIFSVACDNEEQEKVKQAAVLINEEADGIQAQLGRLPESKMLKEKSEELLNLKNKNKQLEQRKNSVEIYCQNLEKLV